MVKGEIFVSEQLICYLDIIKSVFEANTKKEWDELYEPIQVMKKQKLKLMEIDKFEKELDDA